jgi:hypothetical protein
MPQKGEETKGLKCFVYSNGFSRYRELGILEFLKSDQAAK